MDKKRAYVIVNIIWAICISIMVIASAAILTNNP